MRRLCERRRTGTWPARRALGRRAAAASYTAIAHPLCGSLPARAGASPALPPVSGRERDIHYPLQVPSAPTGQISTWQHRFDQRSRQEGEKCVRGELVALTVCEGQASPLGLSLADTEGRRTELQTDSHRRAVETRKRRTARKGAK